MMDILLFQATNATRISLWDFQVCKINKCQAKTSLFPQSRTKILKNFGKNKVDITNTVLHRNWELQENKTEKYKN